MGKELTLFSFKLLARSHSLNALERMREVIVPLEERITLHELPRIADAFSFLIATILSQNTNGRNSSRAFHNLLQRYEIQPTVLAHLKPEEIKPLIKSVGLQELRSRRIIAISKTVLHKFNGDLNHVLKLPLLLSLDGI
jgi:endonuclease-3